MANRSLTPASVRPIDIMPRERPVFLVNGLHKSGTTWVQQILDAHPAAACRTEDMFVKIADGLKEVFQSYNRIIAEEDHRRAKQGVQSFDLDDVVASYFFMIRRALDKAPEEAAWSGIKDNLLNPDAFLSYIPSSRVIHVVRDPRDLAISSWASTLRLSPGRTAPVPAKTPPITEDHIAQVFGAWSDFVSGVLERHTTLPDRVFVVHYEDLIANFEGTVAALFGFLGLARDTETLARIKSATDFEALSGGRGQGQEDTSSFYRTGLAGGWSSREDREMFSGPMRGLADHLARAGYNAEGRARL